MKSNNILILALFFLMFGCSDKNDLPQKTEVFSSEKISVNSEEKSKLKEPISSQNFKDKNNTEDNKTDYIELNTQQEWREYLANITDSKTIYAGDIIYPHEISKSPRVIDFHFESSDNIDKAEYILNGAFFDKNIKKSGVQSICLKKENDALILKNIPVKEGKWYVVSGYMYVKSLPADVMRYYVEFMDGNNNIDIPNYPMLAISKVGEWEEFILPVYIKKDLNVDNIKIVFRNIGEPDAAYAPKSDIWIDDISMYEVKDSASLYGLTPPAKKQVFDGSLVKVDALGNFSIQNEGKFESFLPLIIYPGGDFQGWHKYKEKGFNTIMCNTLDGAEKAVELGMHWIWSLYDYGIYDANKQGYERFEKEYRYLKENRPDILEKLLYFYWDNERYQLFDTVKHFADTIKKIDLDADGKRYRPFTMQLSFTMANPHYINKMYTLCDLQSCYANPMIFEDNDPQNYQGVEFKGNYDGEFANFAIFEHSPGVQVPKSVFVINSPFGDKHIENTIFAAFARGGRGFAYWKDGGSQPKIETKVWWQDFNQTAQKIYKLLPLLRTAHWTDWHLNVSLADDEDGMVVGTRDFGDKRCMITASRSNKKETVRFSGLDTADDTAVIDYFSGKKVASWKDDAFELTFAPRGYGVYCW